MTPPMRPACCLNGGRSRPPRPDASNREPAHRKPGGDDVAVIWLTNRWPRWKSMAARTYESWQARRRGRPLGDPTRKDCVKAFNRSRG